MLLEYACEGEVKKPREGELVRIGVQALVAAASKKNADTKKFEVHHAVPATSPKVIRGFRSVESASHGHGVGQAKPPCRVREMQR